MNEQPQDVLKLSPEKLMTGFTRSRFGLWIGAALVVHVVFIGILSLGYIRDQMDPEGAKQRQAAADALIKAATPAPPKPVAPPPVAVPTAPPSDKTLMEQRSNTPVIKAITQLPATNAAPPQPNDLGISLDDTRVK